MTGRRNASLAVLALLVAALLPAAAQAGFRVISLSGSMQLNEQQCRSAGCSKASLRIDYAPVTSPATRSAPGHGQFPQGLRVAATGTGTCSAETPPVTIVGEDGSVQLLGPASREEPVAVSSSVVLVDAQAHRVRFAWHDPLAPPFACGYLDDPLVSLAVRTPSASVPYSLTSRWVRTAVLERRVVHVTIAGARPWRIASGGGLVASGRGEWVLRLTLGPERAVAPTFVG